MRTDPIFWLIPVAAVATAASAEAKVYLSVEQAQAVLFPGAAFTPSDRTLSAAEVAAIQKQAGQRVLSSRVRAWRASNGGWFIIDQVIGKHEFITYALGLDASGAVRGIEVLEYRESYGGEIREAAWRAQFHGKRSGAPVRVGADIRNIAGATLSCKHLADGVRRLLATHAIALAPNA